MSSDSHIARAGRPGVSFRAAIDGLPGYSAGRSARDLGKGGGAVAALAANEGPYGPFPAALQVLRESVPLANRYPESGSVVLRRCLAESLSLPFERVAVAAGGIAIIHHTSLALLEPGHEILQCTPTFHAYALDARKQGATTVSVPLRPDGSYDLEAMLARIGPMTRLIYVCNPNNPTGGIVRRGELLRFVLSVPPDVLILVDEAYREFVDDLEYPDTVRDEAFHLANVLTLRTFSKAYGLAGLRVAYAVGSPAMVDVLTKVQSNYEVTSLSQCAAVASLAEPAELQRRRDLNRIARKTLMEGLQRLGQTVLPSHANFVCVQVGAARRMAAALESNGVIVRPLDAMGDPTSIRITVGTPVEVLQVLQAFETVLAQRNS